VFSRSKPDDPVPQPGAPPPLPGAGPSEWGPPPPAASVAPRNRAMAASILTADMTITGTVTSAGDIHIEGAVEGDVRAESVGETANVAGEVVAQDIVVGGRVVGTLRGTRVRLAATARVEGDIVH
jgi:cytoskeletal protein CcmA (bactofilin family)